MRHTPITALAAVLLAASTHAQRLEEWITGLDKPVDLVFDPADGSRAFIVEQTGRVRVAVNGTLADIPLVEAEDISGPKSNWERGLLGIALDPGFADNGRFYLDYTDDKGDVVIARFTIGTTSADWDDREILLTIKQPYGNHNGGCIRFGPDGMLYIGVGDGGAANDPHGNGQRLDTLLGKILRIDVTGEPDEGLAYAVPDDNPFVRTEKARPEIWALGLRNPWRFAFDSKGRLWIGDVGQNRFEEVDLIDAGTPGLNFGWNTTEGMGLFRPGRAKRDDPPRLTADRLAERGIAAPVFEYRHHPVASVTGGVFYEGDRYPWLKNRYICADFMSGRVWSFRLRQKNGHPAADDVTEHTGPIGDTFGGKGAGLAISSFAVSPDGQTIYILDHRTGRVLRLEE